MVVARVESPREVHAAILLPEPRSCPDPGRARGVLERPSRGGYAIRVSATPEATAASDGSRERARPGVADAVALAALVVGAAVCWQWRIVATGTTFSLLNADTFGYFLPAYTYEADRIAHGGFPFWNPYQGAGVPFLAMMQPGALYPARLVLLLTSPASTMGWSAFGHVVLTIVGTYLLCRVLGARVLAATAGAIVFTTGFALPYLTQPAQLESGAWAPLVALGVVRILRGSGWGWTALLGVIGALPLLAGDMQTALYDAYAAAIVGLAVVLEERPSARTLGAACVRLAASGALAFATAAPQILTTWAWTAQSFRQREGLSDLAMLPLFTEGARHARLVGFFFRATSSDVWYLSIPVVALAAIALVRGRRLGLVLGFGALATAILGLVHPGTVLFDVYKAIPGFRTFRFPVRITFITTFLAALAASIGLTALGRERLLARPLPRRALDVAGLAVVVALLVLPYANPWELPWTAPLAHTEPDARFFPPPTRPPDDARVFVPGDRFELGLSMFTRQGMTQHVRVLQDYAPLSARRLGSFLSVVAGRLEPTVSFDGAMSSQKIARPDLLDLVAVRGIVALPGSLPAAAVPGWSEVGNLGMLRVYTNARALPRAYVVGRGRVVADDAAALALVASRSFDPRGEAVVVAGPDDENAREVAAAGATELVPATIAVDEPERVVVDLPAKSRGVLVLADAFAPGWEVTVDGVERTLWVANHLVRGVRVDVGDHRVEFRYRAPGFLSGVVLAAVAWTIALVGLVVDALGRRTSHLTLDVTGGMAEP
jgi:hypothetical protein